MELVYRGAAELARMIRDGQASALEVVEAHIARTEAVNPKLNAVVIKLYDEARAAARAVDVARARGDALPPLAGVPITIKESTDLAGTPSTAGIPSRAQKNATTDAPLVATLRRAGAIPIGKTNVSQLLLYQESDNPLYGRTNNPWRLDRTPGGSSGGEAAIVAAGGSPLGLGTDIGGSLRGPAHSCGIATLKPTSGRLDMTGTFNAMRGVQDAILDSAGPLARRVEDLELAMQLLADVRAAAGVRGLRIGVFTDDGFFPTSPAIVRAVREAADKLRDAGANVVDITPPELATATALYLALMSADRWQAVRKLLADDPRDPRITATLRMAAIPYPVRRVLLGTARVFGQRRIATLFSKMAPLDELEREQAAYREKFAAQPIDAVLCPPAHLPAVTHGACDMLTTTFSFCFLFNLLHWPAGVVFGTRVRAGEEHATPPVRDAFRRRWKQVETGSAGLPVGVQIGARPNREDVVLAAMKVLQPGDPERPTI
jgi:Asp-tRNA(Asn)/Glu-tRNA(Gln) amidotransferase A subunit family amidase